MLHFSEIGRKAKLSDDLFILDFWRKGVNSIQLQAFVSTFRLVTDKIVGFLALMAAGISGAAVPILLTRAGQNTASSIILTTVTDVAGFFSFLGTATLLAFLL